MILQGGYVSRQNIPLHNMTLFYITLHDLMLISLRCVAWHYIHCTKWALHCKITLHCITFYFISCRYLHTCMHAYIHRYMGFDQNSFIRERPFFANKNVTFAKLSRTPCLSFAGPMLANNTSYEDSFTTCQITPENQGSLLDSLLNMRLASRNPFSGQIVAD